jgi:flavorubredoxin
MESAHKVPEDLYALPSYLAVPMLGLVPINAFLLKSRQPVLVDTGMAADSAAFLESLRNVIDPKNLKWIWLTHPDPDHIASLHTLPRKRRKPKSSLRSSASASWG